MFVYEKFLTPIERDRIVLEKRVHSIIEEKNVALELKNRREQKEKRKETEK